MGADHSYTTNNELYFTAVTISDYLYAGPGENTSNWLVAGKDKWYWTSTNKSAERARVIGADGCFKYFPQNYTYYVRPVTYLKSNVRISGGSGTASDPYTLQLS